MNVADTSFRWYLAAAKRGRRAHRLTEVGTIMLSASISVVGVLAPGLPAITVIIGAVLVMLTGARAVFKWQENYLRFSQARESVEQQRRLYLVGSAPYEDVATRDQVLVTMISRIERDEMSEWIQIARTSTNVERPAGN